MDTVERSRSLPILFSTLVVGLSPLIPIPVVDDLVTAALCRWRVKYLASLSGLTLSKEEIKSLSDLQSEGCLGALSKRAFGYMIRRILENLLFWLEAGRVVNLLAQSYYDGVLLDYAFSSGLYTPGSRAEAERLRKNIMLVRQGANYRQLKDLLKNSSLHTQKFAKQFIRDIYEQYFRNIPSLLHKGWRRLRKRREEINEQADQNAKNLNESAASWRARYTSLFADFAAAVAKISPAEIEALCMALAAAMKPSVPPVEDGMRAE